MVCTVFVPTMYNLYKQLVAHFKDRWYNEAFVLERFGKAKKLDRLSLIHNEKFSSIKNAASRDHFNPRLPVFLNVEWTFLSLM